MTNTHTQIRRILLFFLLLGLVAPVAAQFPPVRGGSGGDDTVTPVDIPVPANLQGSLTQTAPSGALVKQSNGLYVLIMENASVVSNWQYSAPSANSGALETRVVSRGWREQGALRGTGTLITEDLELELVLMTPFLNPETGILSYTALVTEIVRPVVADPLSVVLNRTVGAMELRVHLDTPFMTLLVEGINLSVANERECSCPPGTPGFLCEICESGGL